MDELEQRLAKMERLHERAQAATQLDRLLLLEIYRVVPEAAQMLENVQRHVSALATGSWEVGAPTLRGTELPNRMRQQLDAFAETLEALSRD